MTPLIINNQTFEYIKTRMYVPVSVYKGEDCFLRIGPKDLISEEISKQKKLIEFGFPIAEILSEGEFENQYYFIEKSLGDEILGDIFWNEMERIGNISSEHFDGFLKITSKFGEAQLNTIQNGEEWESFKESILLNYTLEEFPDLKDNLIKAVEKAQIRLRGIPYVISHGDFNAYNLFWDGVIDMEGIFKAPIGYDLVGNIIHTFLFPNEDGLERMRRYTFSTEQIEKYFQTINQLYRDFGVIEPKLIINDLLFLKMIWSAARMGSMPKLQKWRGKLLDKIIKNYLEDKSVIEILIG